MSNPTFIPQAFAAQGNKNTIDNILSPSGNQGAATWGQGFPPVTSIPPAAGGVAPDRLDFNGIFHALSEHAVFLQNGGVFKFSQDIADASGYAIGSIVMSDDDTKTFISTKNSNKSNPNISLYGWKIFSGDSYTKAEANATFVNKTYVKQEIGTSDTAVMSQKAMTNALLSATGANKKWVNVLSQRPESVNHTNNTTEVLKVFWGCAGTGSLSEFYVDGAQMAVARGTEGDEVYFEVSIPIGSYYMYKVPNATFVKLMELR